MLGIVGKQALFDITLDDMANGIQSVQAKCYGIFEISKKLCGGGAGISKTSKIDGVDLNRTNLQCSTANGIKIRTPYVSIRSGLSLIQPKQLFGCKSPFPSAYQ